MTPSKKVLSSKKKLNNNRISVVNHGDQSSKTMGARQSVQLVDPPSQTFSVAQSTVPHQIMDDFTHDAASSCNALVRCFGPATNPLSYFDPSTEGGKLIFDFYHDPCPSTTTDRYLQYIVQPGYEEIGRRQAYSMTFALQTSYPLILIRKAQLHQDFLLLSASTPMSPDSAASFSASPHYERCETGNSASFEASDVTMTSTTAHPVSSNVGDASEDAFNLFHGQLWALNQAEQLWQWVDFISQEALRLLNSNTVTDSTRSCHNAAAAPAPYNITRSMVLQIAQTIPITTCHPTIIASQFGLLSMDDVLKVTNKNVLYSILESIQDYYKNPHFKVNIARLKKMGILQQSFVTNRLEFTTSMSVSTLRWLIMFYLEIPGYDKNKGSLFELKKKEADHHPQWRTNPIPVIVVAPKRYTRIKTSISSPPPPSRTDRDTSLLPSKSSENTVKKNDDADVVVSVPTPDTPTVGGDTRAETGWVLGIENTDSPSVVRETGALARVVSTCDGNITSTNQ
jgi:hypothetical protein